MGKPTADDPLGMRLDPTSISDMLEQVVDARIRVHLLGRTSDRFNDCTDMTLVHELLARGWAVFKPSANT